MGTILQLRARCRAALANSDEWTDLEIDGFIDRALDLFSVDFPLPVVRDKAILPLVEVHDVGVMRRVVSVQLLGDAPEFLQRSRSDAPGWGLCRCYEVVEAGPLLSAGHLGVRFSFTPASSSFRVAGLTQHHLDGGIVSVREEHWEALVAAVVFFAVSGLVSAEGVDSRSSNISIVLSQLSEASRLAWNRYTQLIEHYRYDGGEAVDVNWGELGGGRIL